MKAKCKLCPFQAENELTQLEEEMYFHMADKHQKEFKEGHNFNKDLENKIVELQKQRKEFWSLEL